MMELCVGSFGMLGVIYSGILLKRSWQKREFLNTLNVSLNSYCTATRQFRYRTIMEANDLKAFVPEGGVEHLRSAAAKTKSEDQYRIKMNPVT